MQNLNLFVLALVCFTTFTMKCRGSTDIVVADTPEHEVRFVSGNTVYIEALIGERWVGRYWSATGLSDIPDEALFAKQSSTNSAFELKLKRAAGEEVHLSDGWQWVSASELPKTDRGHRHFVVELLNRHRPIKVKVHTLLDGTAVLTRWLEITNVSDRPDGITVLSPWSGRLWPEDATVTLGRSTRWDGHWEGWFGWTALKQGLNRIENDRGLDFTDPYFLLRNESNGEYFFGQLAWAANYTMEFQKSEGLAFKIGPSATNVLRVIAPGETVKTPAVHLGHVKADFDSAVQEMHDHIRRSVMPEPIPEKSFCSQYLIPEDWPMTVYRGKDFNESNMKKCIDVAAATGVEAFILDGPMWCSSYGNWLVPNKDRFPRGLAPLVDYSHQKDVLFGLYFETEGGREGYASAFEGSKIGKWSESEVFQKHPDWFVQPQSVLNLSIPEAADYMEDELDKIIEYYKIDIYRHDFNAWIRGQGSETQRDGFVENNYWRHYDAFYGIFNRLRAKYPNLILQQASGGGARSDLGTIGVFHEHFTSDRSSMPYVYQMLCGFSVFLPPEIMVNAHWLCQPEDRPDLDTTLRGVYALGNTPMIFNPMLPKSLEELTPDDRDKFLHYSHLYKNFIRPMLPTCKVFHHAPVNATGGVESGDWFAMEFGSPDRKKAWATIVHLKKTDSNTYLLKPKGLDKQKRYRVTFDNTGKTKVFEGSFLLREGLGIRLEEDSISELLLFEAI